MDDLEVAQELIKFLNDTGQVQSFLDWAGARGFSMEDMESDLERVEES